MSRNIKEIGKELMGKSLSSYHRKTGLSQLEKNNEMQDGILNGILNQVDNAYIEKTEQSNVIHLDGSGDGVVVVDSIKGNTMVNLATVKTITLSNVGSKLISNIPRKSNTVYTLVFDVTSNTATSESDNGIYLWTTSSATVASFVTPNVLKGRCVYTMTSTTDVNDSWSMGCRNQLSGIITIDNIMILEGDWTDKEIPSYFEGLQSSFEENITDEGQYKFEILMKNENVFNYNDFTHTTHSTGVLNSFKDGVVNLNSGVDNGGFYYTINKDYIDTSRDITFSIDVLSVTKNGRFGIHCRQNKFGTNYASILIYKTGICSLTIPANTITDDFMFLIYAPNVGSTDENIVFKNMTISYTSNPKAIPHKQNKIKLLLNEPLRSVGDIKDKLCIKDNKLVVERNCGEGILDGSEDWINQGIQTLENTYYIQTNKFDKNIKREGCYCDKVPNKKIWNTDNEGIAIEGGSTISFDLRIRVNKDKLQEKSIKQYFRDNNHKVCYQLATPIYEEVLNEYGEPILLEGYENGTLYIDSTIVPTTTVRYTPKMESFNTLKEVENNNTLLTYDINDNIIPYMMDVDLMIMEKEMDLISSFNKNIRTMEVLDMTSMQKRTQQMLERLIKGKTLSEQECQTRVTTYLNANKITDEQAEELMLLISEVYA